MSAAAPLPPPYPNSGGASGNKDPRPPSNTSNGGEKAYEHIQDLNRKALTGFDSDAIIPLLIKDAERALNQANTLLSFRRPDMSWVEYIRAYQLVTITIPQSKQWDDFQHHSPEGMQKYYLLQKRIHAADEQYGSIKEIIVNNNKRSGVQPSGGAGPGHVRTESALQTNGNGVSGYSSAAAAHKIKPSPSPKPEKLHGRAISSVPAGTVASGNSGTPDVLNERFARLRGTLDTGRPESKQSISSSVHSSPVSMPDSNIYRSRDSFDILSRSTSGPNSRPFGPRGMPNGNAGPPIPGKLPLDTNLAAAMPKAPSPTYSPARNMQTTGNIAPPRHSARSLASTSSRRTSLAATSVSSIAPNGSHSSGDYFPIPASSKSSGASPSQVLRRKSVHVAQETSITATQLYDFLDRYSILLIDSRSREDFDQGHIYARNVLCIDPVSISQGMSAEQLQDRMVLSPESEQEMFKLRDTYSLVVYYDTGTQSESFLTRPMGELQTKLKYLHEALYDFNQEKPLQRPPILLVGGIDAWTDLVGNQVLATSNTAARAKLGRPIARRPVAGAHTTSQLRNPKRRLREYNPLDAGETEEWRERARAESVVLPTPADLTDKYGEVIDEEAEGDEEEPSSAIREFLERFPDANNIDHHVFAPLHPTKPPPEPPAKVPIYPTAPTPSQWPVPPARPQPAAPRMSYTGVSDRAVSQNAPATRSNSLAPYIPLKYLATNLRLPKTGLVNFGATCYMNSTLQALSATTPLSIFFLDDTFHGLLQRDNWKGTKGVMPELYSNLLRSLWKGDVASIRPTTFMKFCGRLKKEWGNGEQQDAKEFFDFLIDCLHEDLNGMWAKTPLRELTEQEEAKRERMPKSIVVKLEWSRYTHRDQSFVTNLFAGQHMSRITCTTCGFRSTTYETFYSISVEIPKGKSNPSLDDCLRSYCSEEVLTGDEKAFCARCKELRDTHKQITITRAPQFLVVHFKRTHVSERGFFTSTRSAQKITTPINFPLDNLDIRPYMLPPPTSEEAESIARDYGPDALKTDTTMTPPFTYDAYAVIRHHGQTLASGHYTALVKDRARRVWRHFNDQASEDFIPGQGHWRGPNDVRNELAYIVFYQRTPPVSSGGFGKM